MRGTVVLVPRPNNLQGFAAKREVEVWHNLGSALRESTFDESSFAVAQVQVLES